MAEKLDAHWIAFYRAMLRIRRVEEAIAARYHEGQMRCPVHLSIGQEAVAVGVCRALDETDLVFSTHRCHAHYLAKGGHLGRMMAEICGKAEGCIGGRGGSMHLADVSKGMMASVPIVASSIPLAVGTALADRRRKSSRVSAAFIGDASVEEGVFFESVNFAALHRLPVIFVCENNLYSVYTRLEQRQPSRDLKDVVAGHGIAAQAADGNDVLAVNRQMSEAVARARSGGGPALLVFDTYRYLEHCGPNDDDHLGYRGPGELAEWMGRDPLTRLRDLLAAQGLVAEPDLETMEAGIRAEIDEAFDYAYAAALPSPEMAWQHVYAEKVRV